MQNNTIVDASRKPLMERPALHSKHRHKKRQTSQPAFFRRELALLDSDDVLRLGAFLALSHGELNLLAFGQRLEA